MTGVPLVVSALATTADLAAKQRAQLEQVRRHDDDPATAMQAATELLLWYVRFGRMDDAEAQAAIEQGAEDVMRKVAAAAVEVQHGSRVSVTPLDYFPFPRRPGKGGGPKRSGIKAKLLELRGAHTGLTENELRKVLTTCDDRTLPRSKWPATVASVENALVDYLATTYSDVPADQRRAFVRALQILPWDSPKELVTYPAHW